MNHKIRELEREIAELKHKLTQRKLLIETLMEQLQELHVENQNLKEKLGVTDDAN